MEFSDNAAAADNDEEEEMGIIPDDDVSAINGNRVISGGGYRYRECLKNHAVSIGGNAVDGCGEFMAAGDEGTLDALLCAACNCHRNFHRKVLPGAGGGGGGGYCHRPPLTPPFGVAVGGSRKRFRTKFSEEQRDKMVVFSERVGWRIQKKDETAVDEFCGDAGVSRRALKIWMHNNKHNLSKKP